VFRWDAGAVRPQNAIGVRAAERGCRVFRWTWSGGAYGRTGWGRWRGWSRRGWSAGFRCTFSGCAPAQRAGGALPWTRVRCVRPDAAAVCSAERGQAVRSTFG